MRLSTTDRNNIIDAIIARLAGGFIDVYTGSQPSTPGGAVGGSVLLFTYNLAATAAPVASGGQATLNSPTNVPGVALATGTASWARWRTSASAFVMDMSAQELGFYPRTVEVGGPILWNSFTFVAPGL